MLFSIIVPVYNVEDYLPECLDSLLRQDFGDWEAVCVNDGSTDGSGDILQAYASRDSRIRVITQPNGGLSAARNTGIDNAQGEYILFLDSDDFLEPNTLKTLSHNLDGEDLLCFGGWQGEREETPAPEGPVNGWDYYNRHALEHHEFPFVCVVLRCYRRQMLTDNNLRFRVGILHEDNEFTPRVCLAANQVKAIPHRFYRYRVREGSIMTTRGLRSRTSLIKISNDLSDLFGKAKGIDKKTVYQFLTHCYQMAFLDATDEEKRQLLPLVDWKCYRRVSRTKLRHLINYTKLHLFHAR